MFGFIGNDRLWNWNWMDWDWRRVDRLNRFDLRLSRNGSGLGLWWLDRRGCLSGVFSLCGVGPTGTAGVGAGVGAG